MIDLGGRLVFGKGEEVEGNGLRRVMDEGDWSLEGSYTVDVIVWGNERQNRCQSTSRLHVAHVIYTHPRPLHCFILIFITFKEALILFLWWGIGGEIEQQRAVELKCHVLTTWQSEARDPCRRRCSGHVRKGLRFRARLFLLH